VILTVDNAKTEIKKKKKKSERGLKEKEESLPMARQ